MQMTSPEVAVSSSMQLSDGIFVPPVPLVLGSRNVGPAAVVHLSAPPVLLVVRS